MQRKILVLDDEKHIARLIEVNLRRSGHEVSMAYNAQEAICLAESWNPDLMVFDIGMAGERPFAVLKALRANPTAHSLPVIALTRECANVSFHGWPKSPLTTVEDLIRCLEENDFENWDRDA